MLQVQNIACAQFSAINSISSTKDSSMQCLAIESHVYKICRDTSLALQTECVLPSQNLVESLLSWRRVL